MFSNILEGALRMSLLASLLLHSSLAPFAKASLSLTSANSAAYS